MTQPPNDYEEPPADASGEQAATPEIAAAQAASEVSATAEATTAVLDAKAAVEDQLNARMSGVVGAQAAGMHTGAGNFVGVGLGLGQDDNTIDAHQPGRPVLTVYVADHVSARTAREIIADELGVRTEPADLPVSVVVTGVVEAQPHRFRQRPAPAGISVGHVKVTAGTLGCLCIGRTPPRDARVMILSNNHVLANVNDAQFGDCVSQPGTADGGSCPNDQVAILERFVPISFASPNFLDCATAWCWPDRVRPEFLPNLFRIGSAPAAPTLGAAVGKSGRTTQLTSGKITGVGVTVNVDMGGGRIAQFRDQVSVQASSGNFSQGGDSGSVIWTWDANRSPVALLNAGGGGTTFGNRMDRVVSALDIRLHT